MKYILRAFVIIGACLLGFVAGHVDVLRPFVPWTFIVALCIIIAGETVRALCFACDCLEAWRQL